MEQEYKLTLKEKLVVAYWIILTIMWFVFWPIGLIMLAILFGLIDRKDREYKV